jgi:hypothetical protein
MKYAIEIGFGVIHTNFHKDLFRVQKLMGGGDSQTHSVMIS